MDDLDTLIESSFPTTEEAPEVTDETISEEVAEEDGASEDGKPEEDGEPGEEEDGKTDGTDDSEEVETTEEDEAKTEPPKKPKRNKFQERIDQKTREVYELRQKLAEYEAKVESAPPELPAEPDPNKYTFDKNIQGDRERAIAQYNQDVGKWQAECERINAEHENRGVKRIQTEQQKYFSKMANEKSIYGDYTTAVQTLGSYKMTPELHEALLHDDNNTDLFCFLGNPKNQVAANEVFSLKGYQQARKLAEISFKLQAAKARQKAKPSSAKAPVGKPKGGKAGAGGIDFEKMSDADYRKIMGKAKAKLGKF